MSFIQDIEAKLASLEAQVKQHSGVVLEAANAIENLVSQKTASANSLHILNGATQAYKDVLNIAKAGMPAIEAITPIIEAVAPSSAPTIQAAEGIVSAVETSANG